MENMLSNYDKFTRDEWQQFHGQHSKVAITAEELEKIKSLDDEISIEDVRVIYAPIRHLIHIFKHRFQDLQKSKARFLNREIHKTPFVIGISGSVAVGKSTTARLLKLMLTRAYPQYKVDMITTDGFLYPNRILKEKNILDKKGFPESYDMPKLLDFIDKVKENKEAVHYPTYSHETYDVIEDENNYLDKPDILIIEGINTLQLPENELVYISDYFDFSIYVDAEVENIKRWYLERFQKLLDLSVEDENMYYHKMAIGDRVEAMKMAENTWRDVNYKNLVEYIEPTRNRADLILHKGVNHLIDSVFLRKY